LFISSEKEQLQSGFIIVYLFVVGGGNLLSCLDDHEF